MKKLLLAAAIMISSVAANAQNEVGQFSIAPTVGLNMTNITKEDHTKMKFGVAAGVNAEYGISEKFGISLGILYSQQGCKFKYEGVKTKQKMDYLNFPILANYYIVDGLAIKAGIQPGVLLSAKYEGENIKKGCNKFDLAIPVGLSYEVANVVIDARYNIGLTKIYKKKYSDEKANNSVFQFTVGYKFKL